MKFPLLKQVLNFAGTLKVNITKNDFGSTGQDFRSTFNTIHLNSEIVKITGP
jgi:hypothetical protein